MKLASIVALSFLLAPRSVQGGADPGFRQFEDYVVYTNGVIYRCAPDWNRADAIVVHEGRVVFAGDRAAADGFANQQVQRPQFHVGHFDLAGRVMIPGLADAHGHLEGYGDTLGIVDLRGAKTFDELIARVAAAAKSAPKGAWIRGRSWDQNLWPEHEFPRHAKLSAAIADHPVYLKRVDGHAALVNAKALELAKLDGDLRGHDTMQGGEILLDESGHATGVLIDNAMASVESVIPAPTLDERWAKTQRALTAVAALGLTSVHDMSVPIELAERYAAAPAGGPRVFVYVWGNDGLDRERLKKVSAPRDVAPLGRTVGVKLMIDGALGSRGAALLADYADAPGQSGHLLIEASKLRELVDLAAELDLQPAVHAIGDRGNRVVLDTYESVEAARPNLKALRPRVEHAQIVSPDDWSRFEKLGAIPSMQPTHATSDMPWAEARLSKERLSGAYAWKRLRSATTPLAFGSDFPVESPNPLEGLYAAITRSDKNGNPAGGWLADQKLSAKEALEAFTLGAAYAVHEEKELGKLEPGYFADFTVLDVDPLTCDPKALLSAHVFATCVGGQLAYGSLAQAVERH